MNVFCQHCKKQMTADHQGNTCIHCGKPYKKISYMESAKSPETKQTQELEKVLESANISEKAEKKNQQLEKPKKALKKPKKKRFGLIIGVIVVLALLAGGIFFFISTSQTAEDVEKEYIQAIEGEDAGKLVKLISHEDGSKVTKGEAEAHLKYAANVGTDALKQMYTINEFEGSFFTKGYKVVLADQYATHAAGLTFLFNGDKVSGEEKEEEVLYGPLIPGIYVVTADYANGDNKISAEVEMPLINGTSEIIIDIPVSNVSVYIENYDFNPEKIPAYILYDDEKIPFIDGRRESEKFGPVITDGSEMAELVIEMPWGDVKSDPFVLEDRYNYIEVDYLTDDQFEEILAMFALYGDEYIRGLSDKTSEGVTVFTDNFKEIADYSIRDGYYLTGEFIKAQIFKDSLLIYTHEDEMAFDVRGIFTNKTDINTVDNPLELREHESDEIFTIVYKDTWLIDSIKENITSDAELSEEEAVTIDGTGTLFEPTDAIAREKAK